MIYMIGKWRWAFWRRSSKWWKRKADKKGHERKTWGVRTDDVPWNKRFCMFCHRHRSLVLQKTFVYARYTIFKWIYAIKKIFSQKTDKEKKYCQFILYPFLRMGWSIQIQDRTWHGNIGRKCDTGNTYGTCGFRSTFQTSVLAISGTAHCSWFHLIWPKYQIFLILPIFKYMFIKLNS